MHKVAHHMVVYFAHATLYTALDCIIMSRARIQFIAYSRHWWDRVNGNSYFSAQIFDTNMRLKQVLPFQWGSNSHAEDVITSWVQASQKIHEHKHDVRRKIYFDKNNTTKRDCKALGEAQIE